MHLVLLIKKKLHTLSRHLHYHESEHCSRFERASWLHCKRPFLTINSFTIWIYWNRLPVHHPCNKEVKYVCLSHKFSDKLNIYPNICMSIQVTKVLHQLLDKFPICFVLVKAFVLKVRSNSHEKILYIDTTAVQKTTTSSLVEWSFFYFHAICPKMFIVFLCKIDGHPPQKKCPSW